MMRSGLSLPGGKEVHMLGSPNMAFIIRRFLALAVLVGVVLFVIAFSGTIEASYLDLVDSLIADSPSTHSSVEGEFPTSIPLELKPCDDEKGWIEEYISSGLMPRCSLAHQKKIDLLYTWVNGSEALYQTEKKEWQDRSPVFGGQGIQHDRKLRGTERRHREHDELRYSVRSVYKYFHSSFSRIRIVASDFYDATSDRWIGQIPQWLDLNAAHLNGLAMLFTSQLYTSNTDFLPVFNSLALESQFYSIPQEPEDPDIMLYLNDDMFLATEHSVSDFWNPLVGVNMQFDPIATVENQNPSVAEFQGDWNSEWTALRYSNYLLSQRFGWRRRPYAAHHGKPLSRTILQEMEADFRDAIKETAAHRFRSEGRDVNSLFMHMHYIIERHREVLLEAYLVHRCDANGDGHVDFEERQVVQQQIEQALNTRAQRRTSLADQERAYTHIGLPEPKVSKPIWTSQDGYPFVLKHPSNPTSEEDIHAQGPDTFSVTDPPHTRRPTFDFFDMCLTKDFVNPGLAEHKVDAQTLFRLFSKEYPYCGDNLLSILIPTSKSGLFNLLPAPSHPLYSEITKLLHRYSYLITETSSEFIMAGSAEALKKGFTRALATMRTRGLAQFCVNDDVVGDSTAVERMDKTFKGIMQGYFGGLTREGGRSPVEREDKVEPLNAEGQAFWRTAAIKGGPGYEQNI